MLVSHLASKYITSFELPSYDTGYYGLSDFLFLKDSDDLNEIISNITDKLADIGVNDEQSIQDSVNGLIEKVKKLGINEFVK